MEWIVLTQHKLFCDVQTFSENDLHNSLLSYSFDCYYNLVKVLRIIPEFRILRLTFHRKSASKS